VAKVNYRWRTAGEEKKLGRDAEAVTTTATEETRVQTLPGKLCEIQGQPQGRWVRAVSDGASWPNCPGPFAGQLASINL